MENIDVNVAWKKTCVKIGRPTVLLGTVASFIPFIYLCLRYDCWPSADLVLSAWGLLLATSVPFYFIEPLSYYNALGMSGTYMGFMAGNISNMRLACANMALDLTETDRGTLESEVISTLAIAGSVVTSTIVVLLAALVGSAVVAALPEAISSGLASFASPAIFGAMFGSFAVKQPLLAVIGLVIPFILLTLLNAPVGIVLLGSVFGTVGVSRILYVKSKNK